MFTIKRNYCDKTKEILKNMNKFNYAFDKISIDTEKQVISFYDISYINVSQLVIVEIIHSSYDTSHYVRFEKYNGCASNEY